MFKTILIGVDGSEASMHAAQLGVELAKHTQASVILMHVVQPVTLPGDLSFAPLPNLVDNELARGERILEETLEKLGRPAARKLNQLGSPAEALAELAEKEQVDLVVVGSKGRGAVARLLVGSVADRLVHICARPVLVCR